MLNPFASAAPKERRRFIRRLFTSRNVQVVYVRVDEGLLLRSHVVDLSLSGMRLRHETEHVLSQGSRIRVEEAPSQISLLESVQGLIRWVGPGEFGVQFDQVLESEIPQF